MQQDASRAGGICFAGHEPGPWRTRKGASGTHNCMDRFTCPLHVRRDFSGIQSNRAKRSVLTRQADSMGKSVLILICAHLTILPTRTTCVSRKCALSVWRATFSVWINYALLSISRSDFARRGLAGRSTVWAIGIFARDGQPALLRTSRISATRVQRGAVGTFDAARI